MNFFDWITAHALPIIGILLVLVYALFWSTSLSLPLWRRIALMGLLTLMLAYPMYIAVWVGPILFPYPKPAALRVPRGPPEIMTCSKIGYYNTSIKRGSITFSFDNTGGIFEDCHLIVQEPR